MYRPDDILDAFEHVVGWRSDINPRNKIDADLTKSESGLYFQDAHPLVTLSNIRATMPDPADMGFEVWDASLPYATGAMIADSPSRNARVYQAQTDVAAGTPLTNTIAWKPYDFLSGYVRQVTESALRNVIQKFVNDQTVNLQAKSLLENRPLFDGAGRMRDLVQNTGSLVGYEFVSVRSMGVTTKLDKIGFQMVGSGTIHLYIFHSSGTGPKYEYEVPINGANGGFTWFPLDNVYMPYIDAGTNTGGSWFVVYDQTRMGDLQAVNLTRDWSNAPCQCERGNYQLWKQISKYLNVFPFKVSRPEGFDATPQLWDLSQNAYTNTVNYGMNCIVSVMCDLSDFMIHNRLMFQSVIAKQVAVDVLRSMAYNPETRVNARETNVNRTDVLYEIDGNPEGRPGGLAYELKKAYEAVYIDTAGMDRICLPCNNGGVKYRSAF